MTLCYLLVTVIRRTKIALSLQSIEVACIVTFYDLNVEGSSIFIELRSSSI